MLLINGKILSIHFNFEKIIFKAMLNIFAFIFKDQKNTNKKNHNKLIIIFLFSFMTRKVFFF